MENRNENIIDVEAREVVKTTETMKVSNSSSDGTSGENSGSVSDTTFIPKKSITTVSLPSEKTTGKKKVEKNVGKVFPVTARNKIGRNQPCPCGSGKKYKRCCWGRPKIEL